MPKHTSYISLLIIVFSFAGCKKDAYQGGQTKPQDDGKTSVSKLVIDSLDQNGFVVRYQLSSIVKTSGILYATDSTRLNNSNSGNNDIISKVATLNNDSYSVAIKTPYYETTGTYWFKVYFIDNAGKTTYSNIYKQALATYQLSNKFIVKGAGSDNNFSFNNNALIITSLNIDLNVQNYSATISGTPISISNIQNYGGTNPYNYMLFDVPLSIPLGLNKLNLYYKTKLVYSTDVTITAGGLKFIAQNPEQLPAGSYFTYKDQLYVLKHNTGDDIISFSKWNPKDNSWQKLTKPSNDWYTLSMGSLSGYEINDVIYFPPFVDYNFSQDINTTYYDEYITTYTPSTGAWNYKKIFHTNIRAQGKGIQILDCFVYNNKFYCILKENTLGMDNMNGSLVGVIKVYDPIDGSWKKVMDIPAGAWGYRAIVFNNNIYLLAAFTGKQYSAITEFMNKFYILDLGNNTLVEKNHIVDDTIQATNNPYLFVYNDKIYMYGGFSSFGYVSAYNSLFAVYDPVKDSWAPVGNTYAGARISQTNGFVLQFNGTVYVGFGYDNYSNGTSSQYSRNIYSLLLQ